MAFGKTLGSLKVLLMGDSTNLEKTLKGARKGVDTFKGYALKAAGAIGVAFSFTAAIQGLNNFYNKLDEIGKRSSALGVTAEYYQKMQYAAERTGSSIDQVYEAMHKVQKFAGDAKAGNADAQKTFAALGIDMETLERLRSDELFDLVNKQLAAMPTALERTSYGAKLMGESYGKMSNYLRDYISLGEEAQQKGFIIDAEQVKEVEAMKDAFTDVGKAIEVAVAKLVSMSGITGKLLEYAEGLSALAGGADEAERKAGVLSEAEMIVDARRRIQADQKLATAFALGGDNSDKAVKKFANKNHLYSVYDDQSFGEAFADSVVSGGVWGAVKLGKWMLRDKKYLANNTQTEAKALQFSAGQQYATQHAAAAAKAAAEAEARRLAEEHRQIEEEGLANEAAGKELSRIMEEQARARSAAIVASFSAPNRAGVALDGSIAAYKAQFNNDNNYRRWMQENAKKSVDLQAQIAANTAGLQNAVPAVIGADIGA